MRRMERPGGGTGNNIDFDMEGGGAVGGWGFLENAAPAKAARFIVLLRIALTRSFSAVASSLRFLMASAVFSSASAIACSDVALTGAVVWNEPRRDSLSAALMALGSFTP